MTNHELDILVADKVMDGEKVLAPYSTNIESAWAVVRKLSRDNWAMRLDVIRGHAFVEFAYVDYHGVVKTNDMAETVEKAICLAAIKASDLLRKHEQKKAQFQ